MLRHRQRMAGQLAWRTVLPTALMLPMLALVVWWVVSHSLAPLERVRQQLSRRAAQDLAPVDDEDLPAEIQPLVTELNGLLDRVRQAFEQQQHFVADAAHELRSPLAALKLQLQSLRRAPDDAARAQALEKLGQGIDRASHLIEQLLALARQDVFLTVPASFDAVARELTARAAAAAGLEVTLLEEPQAAFYAWLGHEGDAWRKALKVGDLVLVCDVGGGTTDFSLIGVSEKDGKKWIEATKIEKEKA